VTCHPRDRSFCADQLRTSVKTNELTTFATLGLRPALLRAVGDLGFTELTPVQAAAIPPALQGQDVLASAATGSGKTAAFGLPLLQALTEGDGDRHHRTTRALILAPTRELAVQITANLAALGKHTHIRATAVFGGVGFGGQAAAFKRGVDIIVATPGRLQDHLTQGTITLADIEFLIVDEADRMLDMGFLPAVRRILRHLTKPRQTLFFSATIPNDIAVLAGEMLRDPVRIDLAPRKGPAEGITQTVYTIDQARKGDLLVELLKDNNIFSAITFTRTKARANRVAAHLQKHNVSAERIHGDRSQAQRTRALDDFKRGKLRVLVATDIASRGIDIADLGHVINYDVPMVPEEYVHRVGRTARAKALGDAITFVAADEEAFFSQIERTLGKRLDRSKLPELPAFTPLATSPSRPNTRAPFRSGAAAAHGKTTPAANRRNTPAAPKRERRRP
jgi:ATP-dependent RNA helicase RhlE